LKKINLNINEEENKNYNLQLISDLKDENLIDDNKLLKDIALKGELFDKNNNDQKFFFTLERSFVPDSPKCFDFDIESMSYSPSNIIQPSETIKNKFHISNLLTFHQRKIAEMQQQTKTEFADLSSSSQNESSENSSSSENECSDYSSSFISHIENEKKNKNQKEEIIKNSKRGKK